MQHTNRIHVYVRNLMCQLKLFALLFSREGLLDGKQGRAIFDDTKKCICVRKCARCE